ncbi:MAG: hypothetical protein WA876_05000 [Candidatus Acidiferrales bacterium]
MRRLVVLAFVFACVTLPQAFAQTTDAGYDTLSPSLAGVAKSMQATIRRNNGWGAAAKEVELRADSILRVLRARSNFKRSHYPLLTDLQ